VGSRVQGSATEVTVAVLGRRTTCKATPEEVTAFVTLPGPVGTRVLVHASVTAAGSKPVG
jgi:hypothetical protein